MTESSSSDDPWYRGYRWRIVGCVGLAGAGVLAGIVALAMNVHHRAQREAEQAAEDAKSAAAAAPILALGRDLATAKVPPATLREACAGRDIDTTAMVVVMAAADPGASGVPSDLVPSYTAVGRSGFGERTTRFEGASKHLALVRLLDGTQLLHGGTYAWILRRARVHVRIFGSSADPMVCEGIAEGTFRMGGTRGTNDPSDHEEAIQYGLMSAVLSGLCPKPPTGKDSPACQQIARNDRIVYTDVD